MKNRAAQKPVKGLTQFHHKILFSVILFSSSAFLIIRDDLFALALNNRPILFSSWDTKYVIQSYNTYQRTEMILASSQFSLIRHN